MTRGLPALILAPLLMVTACGSDSSEPTTTTAARASSTTAATTAASESRTSGAAPFHAIPDDAAVVWGTAACEFSDEGVDPEGGAGFLVVCELDMSDPRVSGTERQDRFRFVVGRVGAGTVWVAEETAITNAEGTWRGSVQAAEDNEAIPSGEAHYVGEGAYEGLEFHYYFFHADLDEKAELRGWISGRG